MYSRLLRPILKSKPNMCFTYLPRNFNTPETSNLTDLEKIKKELRTIREEKSFIYITDLRKDELKKIQEQQLSYLADNEDIKKELKKIQEQQLSYLADNEDIKKELKKIQEKQIIYFDNGPYFPWKFLFGGIFICYLLTPVSLRD